MYMFRSFAFLFAVLTLCALVAAQTQSSDGLLVIAHGASPAWNQHVIDAVQTTEWSGPKGVAFLMKAAPENELSTVVARLETEGAKRIVVVPLLVSSFSNHFEEIRYYIGDRDTAPEHAHSAPVKASAKLVMTQAMDDHELISKVLADEVKKISTEPEKETVVLVAHGPNSDEDNARWLAKLNHHARRLQQALPFKRVEVTTLRDDAPKPVRDAATEHLRSIVSSASKTSRVLVVPVLISVGQIQKQIHERLAGLDYTMAEFGIVGHPSTKVWILEQATAKSQARK